MDGPNLYTYVRQNPWTYYDPEGLALDTIWDIGNVLVDAGAIVANVGSMAGAGIMYGYGAATGDQFIQASAAKHFKSNAGDRGDATVDAGVDVVAAAVPFVPAGASKALRAADKLSESRKAADAVGETAKTAGAKGGDEAAAATKAATEPVTSRAARREAMRKDGIPTSQQPASQSANAAGREYSYDVPKPGSGTQTKSVQQQTMDRNHPGQWHWEAGKVKTDPLSGETRMTQHDRPKLTNDKSKVEYDE